MASDRNKQPASLLERATVRPPPTKEQIRAQKRYVRSRTGLNVPAFKIGERSVSKKELLICGVFLAAAPILWLFQPAPSSPPQSLYQRAPAPNPVKPLPPGADWHKLIHPNED